MKYYQIKNKTNTQINIEDMGITLIGLGSTARVSEFDLSHSKSIAEVKSLLEITESKSLNIWPFNRRNQQLEKVLRSKVKDLDKNTKSNPKNHEPSNPSIKPEEGRILGMIESKINDLHVPGLKVLKDPKLTESHSHDGSIHDTKIENLINRMGDLIDLISKNAFSQPVAVFKSHPESPSVSSNISDEPMFIPSKIMPEDSTVKVTLQQDEQVRPDLDVASESLKRLRYKNKNKNK